MTTATDYLARAEARYAAVEAKQGTAYLCPRCLGTAVREWEDGTTTCAADGETLRYIGDLLADARRALRWARSVAGVEA